MRKRDIILAGWLFAPAWLIDYVRRHRGA